MDIIQKLFLEDFPNTFEGNYTQRFGRLKTSFSLSSALVYLFMSILIIINKVFKFAESILWGGFANVCNVYWEVLDIYVVI